MGDLSEHFNRKEFACKCGCGYQTIDYELINVLEDVRAFFGKPITINSGTRCEIHNNNIGGSISSLHIIGMAADIVVKDIHEDKVYEYLNIKYFNKYGVGRYDGRTHIDVRSPKARWDKRTA